MKFFKIIFLTLFIATINSISKSAEYVSFSNDEDSDPSSQTNSEPQTIEDISKEILNAIENFEPDRAKSLLEQNPGIAFNKSVLAKATDKYNLLLQLDMSPFEKDVRDRARNDIRTYYELIQLINVMFDVKLDDPKEETCQKEYCCAIL